MQTDERHAYSELQRRTLIAGRDQLQLTWFQIGVFAILKDREKMFEGSALKGWLILVRQLRIEHRQVEDWSDEEPDGCRDRN